MAANPSDLSGPVQLPSTPGRTWVKNRYDGRWYAMPDAWLGTSQTAAAAPADEDRGVGIGDYARAGMAGLAGVGATVGWLLKHAPFMESIGQAVENLGNDAVDYWHEGMSEAAREAASRQFVRKNDETGDYEWGDANLHTLALAGTESLPSMAGGMGIGAGLTKVLRAFANPVGRSALVETIAAGSKAAPGTKEAVRAAQAARKLKLVDSVLGATGFGAGEAAIGGGDAGRQVEKAVSELPLEKLLQSERFREVYDSADDMPEAERQAYARDTIAKEAASQAGWQSGLTTFLLGGGAGAYYGRLLSGGAAEKLAGYMKQLEATAARRVGTSAVIEAGQEFAQSGAQQLAQNRALIDWADPTLDPWDQVFEQAVAGAAVGAPLGAAFGAVTGRQPEETADPFAPVLDAARERSQFNPDRKALPAPEGYQPPRDPADFVVGREGVAQTPEQAQRPRLEAPPVKTDLEVGNEGVARRPGAGARLALPAPTPTDVLAVDAGGVARPQTEGQRGEAVARAGEQQRQQQQGTELGRQETGTNPGRDQPMKIKAARGAIEQAAHSDGEQVPVRYAVVELEDLQASNDHLTGLKNRKYPPELQPRADRTGADIRANSAAPETTFKPAQLLEGGTTGRGTPIIGPDGLVESGNGRVMNLKAMAQRGALGDYTEMVKARAAEVGIAPEHLGAFQQPVLVRVRQQFMEAAERRTFAEKANAEPPGGVDAETVAKLDEAAGYVGWAQEGGGAMISPDAIYEAGEQGFAAAQRLREQNSTLSWIGSDEWRNRPKTSGGLNEQQALAAIEKAKKGEKLNVGEQRFIDYMLERVEANRAEEAERAALQQEVEAESWAKHVAAEREAQLGDLPTLEDVEQFSRMLEQEAAGEQAEIDAFASRDAEGEPSDAAAAPAPTGGEAPAAGGAEAGGRAAGRAEAEDGGLELTAQEPPRETAPARAPEDQDLFGDDTRAAQALADEQRRRDAARNSGQDSVETGDVGDLFSQARQQQDLTQPDAGEVQDAPSQEDAAPASAAPEPDESPLQRGMREERERAASLTRADLEAIPNDLEGAAQWWAPGARIASGAWQSATSAMELAWTRGFTGQQILDARKGAPHLYNEPRAWALHMWDATHPSESGASAVDEALAEFLEEEGITVESILQAERLQSKGYRVFTFHEQDELPQEITRDVMRIRNSVPDALILLPPQDTEVAADNSLAGQLAALSDDAIDALVDDAVQTTGAPETEKPAKKRAKATKPKRAEIRRGRIGDKLASGEVVLTASGRQTSAFPQVKVDTDRKAANTVRAVDRWLMENAFVEAQFRNDDFNARTFFANKDKPSQADKDSAEEYLFGDNQPPVVPSILRDLTEPRPRKATSKAERTDTKDAGAVDRAAKEIAKSLGYNLSGAGENALKGLTTLFGGPGKMSSGLTFDEETYAKAKPYFEAMLRDAQAAGKDLADFVRSLVGAFGSGVKPYLRRFAADLRDDNAPGNAGNLERDRSDPADSEPADAGADGAGGAGVAGAAAEPDVGDGIRGGLPEGDARVVRGGAPAAREPGDQPIRATEGQRRLEGGVAGSDDRAGSDLFGDGRVQADREGAGRAARAAAAGADREAKLAAQRAADRIPVKAGDRANIDATLPYLLPGQREDVHKAETRFAEPAGTGIVFTNGTGTGKTFTGLGVVKRYVRRGKDSILIVAPNDKIIDDWITSGKALGLTINRLQDTESHGESGVVITTYANFGQNETLADRDWDLVVGDEAHYLIQGKEGAATNALQTMRAITLNPEGVFARASMIHRELRRKADAISAANKLASSSDDQRDWQSVDEKGEKEAWAAYDAARNEVIAAAKAVAAKDRPRAVFLSATPFAYEKTVDWGQGYLFDWHDGKEEDGYRSYNVGSNREQFYMLHFGYSMRYNKLNEPGPEVDRGLMQRQFNGWRKKSGALSGRVLDVDADYDRRFVLVDSRIGNRIDAALDWMNETKGLNDYDRQSKHAIADEIRDKFDHLSRRYLLEAIKAQESIPYVRRALELGKKVVVFHDFKKGGGFNPFDLDVSKLKVGEAENMRPLSPAIVEEWRTQFLDLIESEIGTLASPINAYQREFPDLLLFNGDVAPKQRRANVAKFNDDASGPQVFLVQSAAGKEGISLHDTTGEHERILLNLGLPTQPTTAIQQEGRIYRNGQASNAAFRYFNTGTSWEKWAFATTIAERASTAENLGMGEQARALKDAFITAFQEADDYPPGMDGEGTGGKARDRASNEAITEFDRAKAFYWGTQKKNSRTKAREGTDYFATPEPLGLKMMEWANLRPGERVLEPSAGHGAIARWAPSNVQATAIEPSNELASRLAMVFDGSVKVQSFEDLHIVNKFDAIVMNPPFGTAGRTAIDHLDKAVQHLADGGRVVALIPTGPAADAKFEKWYDTAEGVYLVAEIKLPRVTFERAGTEVAARIMVLEKPGKGAAAPNQVSRDYTSHEDIKEFFDAIENASIPDRAKPVAPPADPAPAPAPAAAPAGAPAAAAGARFQAAQFKHTKTGADVFVAKIAARLSDADYKTANAAAKQHGGYYSSFKGAGAIPGFHFKSAEARDRFIGAGSGVTNLYSKRAGAAPELVELYNRWNDGGAVAETDILDLVEFLAGEERVSPALTEAARAYRQSVDEEYELWHGRGDTVDTADRFMEAVGSEVGRATMESRAVARPRAASPAIRNAVRSWLVAAADEIAGAANIHVVDSIEQLRAQKDPAANELVEGVYAPDDGNVWIVADQIESLERAQQVFAHEVFGHLAMEKHADMAAGLRMVHAMHEAKHRVTVELWNEVARRQPGLNRTEHAKEVIALMAERGIRNSAMDRLLAAAKALLRKLGVQLQYSEVELRALIARAGRALRREAATHADRRVAAAVAEPIAALEAAETKGDRRAAREAAIRAEAALADIAPAEGYLYSKAAPMPDAARAAREAVMAGAAEAARPMRDRLRSKVSDAMKADKTAFRQGMVDFAASLEKYERELSGGNLLDAAKSIYKQVLSTQNLGSVMTAVMKSGIPVWKDGSYQVEKGRKGLAAIFEPLTTHADGNLTEHFELYAAARRASRLIKEERENLFTQDQIDAGLALAKQYPALETVFNEWQQFNREALDMMQEAGLIDPEARKVWEHNDYVPFYRAMDDVAGVQGPMNRAGVANQRSGIRTLKGGENKLGSIIENMMMNVAHAVDSSYKNRAATLVADTLNGVAMTKLPIDWKPTPVSASALATALRQIGVDVERLNSEQRATWLKVFRPAAPAGPNIVTVMRDGRPEYYEVLDPLLLRSLTAMRGNQALRQLDVFGLVTGSKRLLTSMVTTHPSFIVANFLRDTLSTWVQSPMNIGVLTGTWRAFRDVMKNDPDFVAIMAAGGGGGQIYDSDPAHIRRLLMRKMPGNQVDGFLSTIVSPRKLWAFYRQLQVAAENANRLRVYRAALASGASQAEAVYQARDVLNFSLRGDHAAVQALAMSVPFLNARLQGLYRLQRGYKENRAAFLMRGAMLAAASLALLAVNWDDERYEELQEWDRDTYWHFWIGDQHFRIPKPFEVGALFAMMPERGVRALLGRDDTRVLGQAISRTMLDTFAFNPIPQLAKPVLEQYQNKLFFTGRPIVGLAQEGLKPEAQYTERTSPILIEIAKAMPDVAPEWLRSPMRLDALVRGYLGSMGISIISAADGLTRAGMGYPDAPSEPLYQHAFSPLSRFARSGEPRTTKYTDELYRMAEAANDAAKTINAYTRQGRIEEAREAKIEFKDQVAARAKLNRLVAQMRRLNQSAQRVMNDQRLTPDTKRQRLDEINAKRNDIARLSAQFSDYF